MRRRDARRRSALEIGVVTGLLLGGCGAVSTPGPVLTVHSGSVTVTDAEGRSLAGSDLDTALPVGVTVLATGDDALIELAWPDESVTRLGNGTSFVIGDESRGVQHGGVTWHRISEQGSGSYRVTLEDGVLVEAQGTGFVIDCSTGPCSIAVFESEVLADGTPVSIHTWAEIRDGLPVGHRPLAWSELFGSEWMRKNAALDTPRFVSAQELYRTEATVPLSFDGAFYRWSLHDEFATCRWPDGTTEGRTSSTTTWQVWPTAAEVIEPGWSWGGDFLVTALEGRATSEVRILEPVTTNDCRLVEYAATEHSRVFATLER